MVTLRGEVDEDCFIGIWNLWGDEIVYWQNGVITGKKDANRTNIRNREPIWDDSINLDNSWKDLVTQKNEEGNPVIFIRIDVNIDEGAIRFWVNKKLQNQLTGVHLMTPGKIDENERFYFVLSFNEYT